MRSRIGLAVVVLVVGAALGLAVAGPPDLTEPAATEVRVNTSTPPADESTTTTSEPSLSGSSLVSEAAPSPPTTTPLSSVRVRAYNSSSTAGAAGTVTTRLKEAGFQMLPAATGPKDKPAQTRVLFKAGFEAQARTVATSLGLELSRAMALGSEDLPGIADTDIAVLVGDDVAAPKRRR